MKDSDYIDVNQFYTTLEEAKEEIWKRWNNASLRKKVTDLFGEIPKPFQESPKALLWRYIKTPNLEFYRFVMMSNKVGLVSLAGEYTSDRLCTGNREKLYLAKIPVIMGRDKNGNDIIQYHKIIDVQKSDGMPFDSIVTLWGENLVRFHRRICDSMYGNEDVATIDWSCLKGNCPREKYEQTFALFTCHGILFENYLLNGKNHKYEQPFVNKVICPAFHKTRETIGVKPLVVRLLDVENEDDLSWQYYPSDIKGFLTGED
ncbi:MAG: hypothetical protein WCJ75_09900 [Desulfomonile sp.]|jgi:hypothetical protein